MKSKFQILAHEGAKLAPECTYSFTVGIGRRKLPSRIRIHVLTRIVKLRICIVCVFSKFSGCVSNERVKSVFI